MPSGVTLLETLETMGMSQAQLAAAIGITEENVSALVKGNEGLSEDTALKLERVLGVDAVFWRNLEQRYRRHLAGQKGKIP